ncbi:MAG: GNAT family N-acetyltransferase [Clostridiales bacterium]|nr:GNAT family N-acetyltransferase [Clostridiales bacterium]
MYTENRSDREGLNEKYAFRCIRPEEAEQAAEIEEICFPPNEACTREMMLERAARRSEEFLVAVDKGSGRLAGFLNGLATTETVFRDAFFMDAGLQDPKGNVVMLLGLDVLPEHRGQGLARELMRRYAQMERERGRECLVLTCLPDKVEMYRKMGFTDRGISNSTWGGEAWHEMTLCLGKEDRQADI